MVVPSFTGESIPAWFMSLGLVVFSNIIYLFIYSFIINDVILTAFRIILSTWLYNYYHYSVNMPFCTTCTPYPVCNCYYIRTLYCVYSAPSVIQTLGYQTVEMTTLIRVFCLRCMFY